MRSNSPNKRQVTDVLRRRLSLLAGEGQSRRADAAVQRVLSLLSDDNLATEAAKAHSADSFELECGVLDQVWEDPRIFNRRNQLQRQGIIVERTPVETIIAGRIFRRTRLRVRF